jgi:hypothetical protein
MEAKHIRSEKGKQLVLNDAKFCEAIFKSNIYCSHPSIYIQSVSAKTFEPNNSVIFQRIFVKFKMQIF